MRDKKTLLLKLIPVIPLMGTYILNAQATIEEYKTATDSITPISFLEHLKYLSSDELKGRGVGTEEYSLAADYVANEFKNNGLQPFGDSGTFFQQVKLLKPALNKESFDLQIQLGTDTIKASYGSDVSIVLNYEDEYINKELNMVFVGYGNIVPSKNIDDYQDIDVKGKMVIVALGGPNGIEDPVFNDRQVKFANAIAHGAAGILLYYPKANLFQNLIFKKVHGYLSEKMMFLSNTSKNRKNQSNVLSLSIFSKKKFISNILELNGHSLKSELKKMKRGYFVSKELGAKMTCRFNVQRDGITSKNVIALQPGSNDGPSKEYVVVGAHLDGLGIGNPVKGDSIYNGMLDNASGVSAILEISKAFGKLTHRPNRSIIFICYTAEETGLLGSNYFLNHNNINDGSIVANINIDMLAQTFDSKDMAPLGYLHSNLSTAVDFAGAVMDIEIDDHQQAERKYMERSDQISFIKKGIPSLFVTGGIHASEGHKSGEKVFDKWMKQIYHSPFDDWKQVYSEDEFLKAIRFNFLTTYYISYLMNDKVKWNRDGWLYRKYVKTGK